MVFDVTDRFERQRGGALLQRHEGVAFDNTLVQAPINIDDDHTDWRAGIDYKFTDDMLTYASVATGYRPPAYNPRPFRPEQAVAVGGEEATAYELGFKSELFDRRLRANIAAFYTDYKSASCRSAEPSAREHRRNPRTPAQYQDSDGNYCFATDIVDELSAAARTVRSRGRNWSSSGDPSTPCRSAASSATRTGVLRRSTIATSISTVSRIRASFAVMRRPLFRSTTGASARPTISRSRTVRS